MTLHPTPPYCLCCSVTKRTDSGIAEASKDAKQAEFGPKKDQIRWAGTDLGMFQKNVRLGYLKLSPPPLRSADRKMYTDDFTQLFFVSP